MDVRISADPSGLADDAADLIAGLVSGAGGADLGLAGGSTPTETYRRLRSRDVDWSAVDVWLSDERWVPHESDDSNGKMARETLVDHVDAPFHRPRHSPHIEPEESAAYYEATLRRIVTDGRSRAVLLGMGTDGHCASLFPGTEILDSDSERWFIAHHVDQLDAWRLTVTPHFLRRAETIVVIVSGSDKAQVLAEAVERPAGRYPIELLHDVDGEVVVMADADAAAELS